ncbi:primosomal protein N' [Hydrogenophaga crassostreae]|uniref:Replication restart protein PriA n=1 Tax=Hydrogenophaga crassostreae TaxID=1763535 RepID=A0A167HDU5_9BURK|nr:primosomal protein N' [Hydrogenophaga crassostreae]AOW12080.1 primosomal protein N' [Hydrogenophaga crassostreae]OAD41024.1 primosomal protein N' [Hydrogenophaga crassostreae]
MVFWPSVIVATPAHSGVGHTLSYRSEFLLTPGTLVRVPLGTREVLGVVWDCPNAAPEDLNEAKAKNVIGALEGLPPLNARWLRLIRFASQYYQRGLGEVALAALPPQLRELDAAQLARRMKKRAKLATAMPDGDTPASDAADTGHELSEEQAQALAALETAQAPVLLFGATGSGKTEVYLRATRRALDATAPGNVTTQVLVMVPEINLTPQLEARFRERFEPVYGAGAVVCLHSGMTPAQRLASWLAAHTGGARIVLGTRMAIFASMPGLRLIVVDEEHDPSYKSQEGARYSARDLAVYRAKLESDALAGQGQRCLIILGSATPSLESWHAADQGRYLRLAMPARIGGGALPRLRLVDMNHQPKGAVIAPPLLAAMAERIERGEQCLVLLNRRGYAPVLACHECGWKSGCPHCSAYRVFHKLDRTLRCHHCGFTERVPRACPDCGNLDIAPVGRGTEQLEEQIAQLLAGVKRPDGEPPRVARMDADTTRLKGSLETQLAALHSGEVDVLVGTQMIAKGHDFRRITLVAGLNADSALFASDYRAPERLFALLMQAAGRAGRDAAFMGTQGGASEMWIQTWYPQHPLFATLRTHDFPAFATEQLEERESAAMPPYGSQALLRADARTQAAAQAFLNIAADQAAGLPHRDEITLYPAVPLSIQRVANVERAQMLVECASRSELQRFLAAWQPVLHACRSAPEAKGLVRWAVDVDPLTI